MNTQAGLWIDHREAVVVVLREEDVVAVSHISSHVEKDHRLAGGSRSATPYGPQDVASEQQFERRRMHQLDRFFDDVTDSIFRAHQIFIMGPGEGKCEFIKHFRKSKEMKDRHIAVETRDKMTENQIVEAVKMFYSLLNKPGH